MIYFTVIRKLYQKTNLMNFHIKSVTFTLQWILSYLLYIETSIVGDVSFSI